MPGSELSPRRFNVGRCEPESVPPAPTIFAFDIAIILDLILLKSDVLTMYSSWSGNLAIRALTLVMRSGVGGCVSNALAIVPGFDLSSFWIFSKNFTRYAGSYPAAQAYSPQPGIKNPSCCSNAKMDCTPKLRHGGSD